MLECETIILLQNTPWSRNPY